MHKDFKKRVLFKSIFCLLCFIFGIILGVFIPIDSIARKKYYVTFTGKLGSTKKEVLVNQGKPTAEVNNVWLYNESSVIFDKKGRVRGWYNVDGSLKIY